MMDVMAQQERQFVIVTPNQSVGKPGAKVTASQLGMTDQQLDDWVDAGHATEIHQYRPPATPVTKVTRSESKSDGGASTAD